MNTKPEKTIEGEAVAIDWNEFESKESVIPPDSNNETKEEPLENNEDEKPVAIEIDKNSDVIINDSPDSILPESEIDDNDIENTSVPSATIKKWKWEVTTIIALISLIVFIIGFEIYEILSGYFTQSLIVGAITSALFAIVFTGFTVFIFREINFLRRVKQVDNVKAALQNALDTDNGNEAKRAIRKLLKLYENRVDLKEKREKVIKRLDEVMDGRDIIGLTEVDFFTTMDAQARKLILASAVRVAVGTAVSPKAFVDMLIIFGENFRLIRNLAELYGARPGKIGMYRLIKRVVFASAFAGVVEAGSAFLTELLGVGILTKLTRKAGEGVANGTLTIRIGLATVYICRPCPIVKTENFKLSEFVKSMFASFRKKVPEESENAKS